MTKKSIALFAVILVITFVTGTVFSDGVKQTIDVLFNNVNLEVNGEKVEVDNILYKGTTYVPIRAVAEMLGKEVGWDGKTNTASINDKELNDKTDNINLDELNNEEVIYAEYIGKVNEKPGDKWYKVSTKYTDVYFYDKAVKMEWVTEEIDDIFENILSFRNQKWDGYRLPIYFLDEAQELKSDFNYYGSGYERNKRVITLSADIVSTEMNHRKGSFTEDPRVTLTHEISHHLNIPKYLNGDGLWLEESLAYYLAYNYDFKEINSKLFREEALNRKLEDFLDTNGKYDLEKWLDASIHRNINNLSNSEIVETFTIPSINQLHGGRSSVNVRVLETSVIEFLIDEYGKEKLVNLYSNLHNKNSRNYDFNGEVQKVYGKNLDTLSEEWREFIGIKDIYDNAKENMGTSNNTNVKAVEEFYNEPDKNTSEIFKGYFTNTDYSEPKAFINSGEQTEVTDAAKKIASQFNNKKDISTIKEIYKWMSENLHNGEGEKFGRTSDEILTSKMVTGCTDYGLAFIALTRAKEIPSVFVQTARIDWIEKRVNNTRGSGSITGHILVEVLLDGKWYLVDSTAGKIYLDYDKNNFSLSDGYYVFAKSLEVWDSGALNEKENHEVMMDLFKDFNLEAYDNPKYDYIDLLSGERKKSYEFKGESTVVGNSATILGQKDPVELFDAKYTNGFNKKKLASFTSITKGDLSSSARIVILYTPHQHATEDIIRYVPEINNSKENFIMNTFREGRRIILIKAENESKLMDMIEELDDDFLDKNYEGN